MARLDSLFAIARDQFGSVNHGHEGGDFIWLDFPTMGDMSAFVARVCDLYPHTFELRGSRQHADRNRIRARYRPPTHERPTPPVDGSRGAPLGRANCNTYTDQKGETYALTVNEHARPFHLVRVPLSRDGYDSGGAYWGIGDRLYFFECAGIYGYVRARHREEAKRAVVKLHPKARFYR